MPAATWLLGSRAAQDCLPRSPFDERQQCRTLKTNRVLAVMPSMTITVKSKKLLTVPEPVRRRAGFKPGDQVEFKASSGVITIRELPSADEYTPTQRRIIDAHLDEAENRPFYGPFNTVDGMIAHLKGEIKRRMKPPAAVDISTPFPCFGLPKDAEPITLDQTLQAEDEL